MILETQIQSKPNLEINKVSCDTCVCVGGESQGLNTHAKPKFKTI